MKIRYEHQPGNLSCENNLTILFLALLFIMGSMQTNAQINISVIDGSTSNSLPASVKFLLIAPDARSSGMGDVGVATTPGMNAQHWNPAKYPFAEGDGGFAVSYCPWLREIGIDRMSLSYLAGYYRLNSKNTLSSSVRYLSLGKYNYLTSSGTVGEIIRPNEYAIDAAWSRKLAANFSGSILLRYIRSDIHASDDPEYHPGNAVAADLSFYYRDKIRTANHRTRWALGLNISNLGTPISYISHEDKIPIPSNLRLGGSIEYDFNPQHTISLNVDLNKLLVPTPGVYITDSITGDRVLLYGKDEPSTVIEGMYRSFYDAPGYVREDGSRSVLLEELHEVMIGTGIEYSWNDILRLRTGYFHDHETKGNRRYYTFGFGVHIRYYNIDFSWLKPLTERSPLEGVYRIMFSMELGREKGTSVPVKLWKE